MVAVKYALLFLLVTVMTMPAIQSGFGIVTSKPLNGAFTNTSLPAFTFKSWMSGQYQDHYCRNTEDSVGFKPDWVRLHNQLDFSIFSVPHPSTVIRGKNGNYFTLEYITASLGYDHLNRGLIDQRVHKLRRLQRFLWEEKKIFLMVVVAPDKVLFYPEDLPDRFTRRKPGCSGRDYLVKRCVGNDIRLIDFNPWFRQMKDTSRWLLFPATGVHWSVYGSVLAADSAIRYIESGLRRPMRHLQIDHVEISAKPRQFDDDVNVTMNLIGEVAHPLLAYPAFHFTGERTCTKPKALFVGDSFYWAWYDTGIIGQVFDKMEFWYYDREVYPEKFTKPKYTSTVDIRQAIERQEVIVLLQVGGGWGNPGAGFIDRAYAAYFPAATGDKLN
jgi:hypothetical protein